MAARNFSSVAVATTLSAGITNSATSITVAALSGYPSAPFIARIDADTASEEVVLVTAVAGTTLTVTRGYDSTVAVSHSSGASFGHAASAIDFREANDHVNASTGVHGVTGSVVGTSDTQTLTNKTISGGTLSGTLAGSPTLSGQYIFSSASAPQVTFGDGSAQVRLRLNGATATTRAIDIYTNGSARWLFGATDATESGSNAGTDFVIWRYTDAGAFVDAPLSINRASGVTSLSNLSVNGTSNLASAWTSYTPTLSGWTAGNGTATGAYVQIGKTVHFRASFTFGSTSAVAAGITPKLSLPVTAISGIAGQPLMGNGMFRDDSAATVYDTVVRIASTTTVQVSIPGSSGVETQPSATTPFTWTTNDVIYITGTYEAA